MKIRNLQEYIQNYCSESCEHSLELLYSENRNAEPFLGSILGKKGSVDNMVTNCASFATDAELQVFFEFVQNAFDANANDAFFYAGNVEGQDYLIVLNNGLPFYTDPDNGNTSSMRGGQLFSFLNKGKSDKPDEEGNLGKFGMGSKLLYALLTPSSTSFSATKLMKKTLVDQRKAPYLISWADGIQLDNFLLDRNQWDRSCGFDNTELLVAKILCCYYPIEPGVDPQLFGDKEVSDLVNVFDKLVNPKRNLNKLNKQGTALIIPLGVGKLDIIKKEGNLTKIGNCLAPFSSIISGYEEFKGKNLSRIELFDHLVEEIHPDKLSVKITKDEEIGVNEDNDEIETYQFVFDKTLISPNCVNLYRALPVSETCYGLNFIIDSQDIPCDQSRQNITEKEVAKTNLAKAMAEMIKELEVLKSTDMPKFLRIYDCLIRSCPNNEIVKQPFDEIIIPYLKQNIKTQDGTFQKLEEVVNPQSNITIPFSQIGVSDVYAVEQSIVDHYNTLGITISDLSFSAIISKADKVKLENWISQLSAEDYCLFHKDVIGVVKSNNAIKLLRTSKGNVVTYDTVCNETSAVYFKDVAENIISSSCLEYVEEKLESVKPYDSINLTIKKIKSNIASYTSSNDIELICHLLNELDKTTSTSKFIREEIILLKNMSGTQDSFVNLFNVRPSDSVLYEHYIAKAPLPQYAKCEWFVQTGEIWGWIKRHWSDLIKLDDWDVLHDAYIKDLKVAHNNATSKSDVSLYLDANGIPVETEYVYIKGTNKENFSEDTYNVLTQVFSNYNIVPFKFRITLTSTPFKLNGVEFSDLFLSESKTVSLLEGQFQIISTFVPNFWDKYHANVVNGEVCITPLEKNQCNYWTSVELTDDEEQNLTNAGFLRVKNIICPDNTYDILMNPTLLDDAIEKVSSRLMLFPIIKKCTNVPTSYCGKLETLDFESTKKIEENSREWNLISWFANHEDYIDKVWNKITMDGETLPTGNLCPDRVNVKDGEVYNAYTLLPRLKEEDTLVKKFKEIVPDETLFESKYCRKRRTTITTTEVINELNLDALSLYQLEFCLDCATHENNVSGDLSLTDESETNDALEMIFKRKFMHFYRKFKISDLDVSTQVYAEEDYLLDSEKLPQIIYNWIQRHEHESVLDLFGKQHLSKNNCLVGARKAILNKSQITLPKSISDDDLWLLSNTFDWLLEIQNANKVCMYHSSKELDIVKKLQALVQPSDKAPWLLKYTSTNNEKDDIIYELVQPTSKDLVFLSINSTEQRKRLFNFFKEKNEQIVKFFEEHEIYLPLEPKELMRKHSLANNPMLTIKYESAKDASWKEWTDSTYKEWLQMPESEGIRIYASESQISSRLKFLNGQECMIDLPISEGAFYGHSVDDKGKLTEVAVVFPNHEDINMFKALENKVVPNVEDFQTPFIALQGLKLQELMDNDVVDIDKSIIDILKECSDEDLANIKAKNFGTGNGAGNGTGAGDGTGNGNGKQDKKEDDDETKENKISGFIGELLYNRFLEITGHESDWAAQDYEGRYDFVVDKQYFVEIKTNVRTIRDGKSPFFLHKMQMEFLHSIDTDKYYVCRLSLTDLGLYPEYKSIRDQFGTYEDPQKNMQLKNACIDTVNRYWENSNRIQDFKDSRRIYRIKDIFLEATNFV